MTDEALQVAARLVMGTESWLIVQVGGTVVTGQPVTVKEWRNWAAANMGITPDLHSDVAEVLENVHQESATPKSWDVPYLHLANAYTFNGRIRVQLGYWRCAFADVQGWGLGALE